MPPAPDFNVDEFSGQCVPSRKKKTPIFVYRSAPSPSTLRLGARALVLRGECVVAMGVFFARTGIDCGPHTVRHHGCWRCRSEYLGWIIMLSQDRAWGVSQTFFPLGSKAVILFLRNGTDVVLSCAEGYARTDGRTDGRKDEQPGGRATAMPRAHGNCVRSWHARAREMLRAESFRFEHSALFRERGRNGAALDISGARLRA